MLMFTPMSYINFYSVMQKNLRNYGKRFVTLIKN